MPRAQVPGRLVAADAVRTPSGVAGDAVLIEGDRVAALGTVDELRHRAGHIDTYSGTIIPGLRDAHFHPVGYAASLHHPVLKDAGDFSGLRELVGAAAASQPAGTAITGLRLDDEALAEGRLPDRTVLDEISTDRPILLVRYCGHVSVANTKALEAAGIGPDTPDPAGGSIDRDDAGVPTGVLRETASDLVSTAIRALAPPVTPGQIVDACTALAGLGLTGIGAIVGTDAGCWAGSGSELDALLAAGPHQPLDVGVLVIASTPAELRASATRIGETEGVRFLGWKAFSDGSLGGHTASMHDPFSDRATSGTDRLDQRWAVEMAETALEIGGRVAIHAIGDAANGTVLDVMERLLDRGADAHRLRIEHASVLTERDIARFGRLGITACVQPAFLSSETTWLARRVGSERLARTYAFRSLLDAGTPLAGSSDCPVEPPHPLWGMATARDRAGIVPEQSLDAAEAFALFTSGSATAIGSDASLAPGSPADLVVLDVDPVSASAEELRAATVAATYVAGTTVTVPEGLTAWVA